jgi:hypothetical protein
MLYWPRGLPGRLLGALVVVVVVGGCSSAEQQALPKAPSDKNCSYDLAAGQHEFVGVTAVTKSVVSEEEIRGALTKVEDCVVGWSFPRGKGLVINFDPHATLANQNYAAAYLRSTGLFISVRVVLRS